MQWMLVLLHISYTCLANFVHPWELRRSAGTYFSYLTQSVSMTTMFMFWKPHYTVKKSQKKSFVWRKKKPDQIFITHIVAFDSQILADYIVSPAYIRPSQRNSVLWVHISPEKARVIGAQKIHKLASCHSKSLQFSFPSQYCKMWDLSLILGNRWS